MKIEKKIDKYLMDENIINFNKYNNKEVIITTRKEAKYKGLMVAKKGDTIKVLLKNMIILNKDGSVKAVSGNKEENQRLFNRKSIKKVEVSNKI